MTEIIEIEKKTVERISVVCPFYNEEAIMGFAAKKMVENLEKTGLDWEFILVNDGSTDKSLHILRDAAGKNNRVKIVTYIANKGRGYALKAGIDRAKGDIIVTTEIDLSWGDDIVERIISQFKKNPDLDVVIASPNLAGGAYKNVPFKRMVFSKFGNWLIKSLFTRKITMNTGMTRGYRRDIIQNLHTLENGKEFHLEVLLKLFYLGAKIEEIPAVLEWRHGKGIAKKRGASTDINKLIVSHLKFMFFARPIRYFWFISLALSLSSVYFLSCAIYRFSTGEVSAYMGIVAILLAIFAILFFGFGIVTEQNINILKELWKKR